MMRILGFAFILLAFSKPVLGCSLPSERPHNSGFSLSQGLSTQSFVDHVTEAIGDDVMGYGVILRDPQGEIVAHISHGWAQSPCESNGGRAFSLDTVTPWASVSKMVTTAAVLNKIHRFGSKSLSDPMTDYLPLRWQPGCDGTGDCWKDATIRHLLSYRAGFKGSVNDDYSVRVETGATERPVGQRAYSNENFGIWNYMGAFFAEGRMHQIDEAYHGDADNYDAVMFIGTRGIWTDYLEQNVFSPIGIEGACADVGFAGDNFALTYNYKTGDGSDETGYRGNPEDTPNCTSGGIVMSLRDMSIFTHSLANTDRVITARQFTKHLAREDDKLLGWNTSIATTDGRMFLKAGGSSKGGGHLGAHIMVFSSGYTATIVTNSFPRETSSWKRHKVIQSGYEAGLSNATGSFTNN